MDQHHLMPGSSRGTESLSGTTCQIKSTSASTTGCKRERGGTFAIQYHIPSLAVFCCILPYQTCTITFASRMDSFSVPVLMICSRTHDFTFDQTMTCRHKASVIRGDTSTLASPHASFAVFGVSRGNNSPTSLNVNTIVVVQQNSFGGSQPDKLKKTGCIPHLKHYSSSIASSSILAAFLPPNSFSSPP